MTNEQLDTGKRAYLAHLLTLARIQSGKIQQARGNVGGNSDLCSRLDGMAHQVSDAMSQLASALNSSSLGQVDLATLAFSVNIDTSALAAEANAHASRAIRELALAVTSDATRGEVQDLSNDIFNRRIFEKSMHFDPSTNEEAAFRAREAEARKYIDEQLALHTSEGDLNAAGRLQVYMLDAQTYGAGDSKDFMPRWNELLEQTERQRAAMRADGQSTDKYDAMLNDSIRSFLKAKRLPEAEIAEQLKGGNPLEAVKSYLGNDSDSHDLQKRAAAIVQAGYTALSLLPRVEASASTPLLADNTTQAINFGAVNAKLTASGVEPSDTDAPGHGLTPQRPVNKDVQSSVAV